MAYDPLQIELYNNLRGINERASDYITPDGFFLNLRNYGFERPGSLISRPGTTDYVSLGFASFLVAPRFIDFFANSSGSFLVFDSGNGLFGLTTTQAPTQLGESLTSGATISYPIDWVLASDKLYVANGNYFHSYLGATTVNLKYSMPVPSGWNTANSLTFTIGATSGGSVTLALGSGTYIGTYGYYRYPGSENDLGQPMLNSSLFSYFHAAATLVGTRFIIDLPARKEAVSSVDPAFGISGVGVYIAPPGSTFQHVTSVNSSGLYNAFSANITKDIDGESGFFENKLGVAYFSLQPQFLEIYKNMMFVAGISGLPSTVYHTELAEYENIPTENFFEVRTDNGDNITCLKLWQNSLVIFKNRSVHELTGESPETLSLKDATLEYGCVNNDAAVTFEDKLWFVDRRGICEYAGSNTFIVSDAVSTTFASVDVSKAKAFHVKKRNEVWFCFGAVCLIYDYNAQGWTIYDRLSIETGVGSNILAYGASTSDLSFFITGTSHFPLVRFRDDLATDRGSAITLISRAPFFKRMGDTTQEMFRRFYLDGSSIAASATLQMYQDYVASVVYSTNFALNDFQKRVDFGVSAKALSPELIISASSRVTINGYALHARFLRNV